MVLQEIAKLQNFLHSKQPDVRYSARILQSHPFPKSRNCKRQGFLCYAVKRYLSIFVDIRGIMKQDLGYLFIISST